MWTRLSPAEAFGLACLLGGLMLLIGALVVTLLMAAGVTPSRDMLPLVLGIPAAILTFTGFYVMARPGGTG